MEAQNEVSKCIIESLFNNLKSFKIEINYYVIAK